MDDNVRVNTRTMQSTGENLSILGFGCMRFRRRLGVIDMEKAEALVRTAIESGVNYFDTAWMYPGNEAAVGAIMEKADAAGRRLRDGVNIATKLPVMLVKSRADMDRYLSTSLERLRTDRVDYYLMHSMVNPGSWEFMKSLGAEGFIEEARVSGKVRHIGFSWHGNLRDFKLVVDDYPWDFVQIQLNYLDEHFQAGLEGMRYAAGKGLGVVVMEPLRGGTLVDKIPPEAKKIMEAYRDGSGAVGSTAKWGLKWVWNHPEVSLLLSGMNEEAQLAENIEAASEAEAGMLTSSDLKMIEEVKGVFNRALKTNCTGCAYCMPCPAGVNIPQCFSYYNTKAVFGGLNAPFSYLIHTAGNRGAPPSRASRCKRCGACEKKCPQALPIMDLLKDAAKDMEKPLFRFVAGVAAKFMGGGARRRTEEKPL